MSKTNWALPLDKSVYMAYGLTYGMAPLSYRVFWFHSTNAPAKGITFTYAELKTGTSAQVLNNEGLRMPGLWVVGDGFLPLTIRVVLSCRKEQCLNGLQDRRR